MHDIPRITENQATSYFRISALFGIIVMRILKSIEVTNLHKPYA
jgi:hypothetical protein